MMSKEDLLQWVGAVVIIVGHSLNAVGPTAYPYNIVAFAIGTVLFLVWSLLVRNNPQLIVNVVSLLIAVAGLIKLL